MRFYWKMLFISVILGQSAPSLPKTVNEQPCDKYEYMVYGLSVDLEKECMELMREGNAEATAIIGMHLIDNDQKEVGFMALEKAAENNNSFALYWLGVTHFEKMVPNSDPKKAFVYFNKVKGELEASALTHVGVMYAEGIGVPEDMHQAMVLFQKAAKIIEKPIKDKKLAEKIGADNWLRYCWKMAGNELAHHIGKYNLDIGKAPQE